MMGVPTATSDMNMIQASDIQDPPLERTESLAEVSSRKVYRIKYTLNLLPGVVSRGTMKDLGEISLMELLSDTEDLDLFDTKVVKDLIQFYWINYASHIHLFGFCIHLLYVITFFIYVSLVYQDRDWAARTHLVILMFICLLYSIIYEFLQMSRHGIHRYLRETWNILD